MKHRIAVWLRNRTISCWSMTEAQYQRLADALPQCEIVNCTGRDAFVQTLAHADIAVVWVFKQSWLAQAPNLRWLVTPAAGRDYFTLDPPERLELAYGAFHGPLIGETVLGYMLAHARGISAGRQLTGPNTPWPRGEVAGRMRQLRGQRIMIVGFGHIGQWIGRLAKPLGVSLVGLRRGALTQRPDYFDSSDRLVGPEALDRELSAADVVVLALPATMETDRLINEKRLSLMRRQAILINIGRGNAIDEAALVEALHREQISAAYLDVFSQEPLSEDSALFRCSNAILMPHVSACAPNYLDLFVDEFVRRYRRRYRTNSANGER